MLMKISILIPTYHNPRKLERCLAALEKQKHLPDEVVVMYEKGDEETEEVVKDYNGDLKLISLQLANMEHMSSTMNAGISKAKGDIIAFLDEDVMPQREWVQKLVAEFSDEGVAACGGKDTIVVKGRRVFDDTVEEVGVLKWKGYIVGNQHRGRARRDVTFLKGCNMAARKGFLEKLDENLLGLVRWEQDIYFSIRRKGRRVIYDPDIEVMHHKDSLQPLPSRFVFWFSHNTVYLFLKYLRGSERPLAVLFYFIIGDVSSPGLIRCIHWILTRNDQAMCSFCASMIGKVKGLATYCHALKDSGREGS
jgi:cellulose synthase/poly-beta-1,6-N-acetylglucosamine synthase-like glycosyltransferase